MKVGRLAQHFPISLHSRTYITNTNRTQHAYQHNHTDDSGFHFVRILNFVREVAGYRFLKHGDFCNDKVIPAFFGVVYNVPAARGLALLERF